VLLTAACQHPTPTVKPDFLTANIDSYGQPEGQFLPVCQWRLDQADAYPG
jgi:hypothetical protein